MMVGMDAVTRWHHLLTEHPVSPEAFFDSVRSSGAIYRDSPLCLHRRPHFVTGPQIQRTARILATFHGLIRKVRAAMLEDGLSGREGSLAHQVDLDPKTLELARIEPGYSSAAVLARVDCFTPRGHPWLLELNGESPAGFAYTDALTDLFKTDPITDRFKHLTSFSNASAVVRAILQTYQSWQGYDGNAPRVAIVDFEDVPTAPEFELFVEHFRSAGVDCGVVDPRSLEFDGKVLTHGVARIDLVYRRLLVRDILERPDDCRALVDAYRAGAICMVNSLRTCLLHTKTLFALLHSEAFQQKLTATERKVIREHVPYTARLRSEPGPLTPPGLMREVLEHPENWVLKPSTGHGGQGIVLGWEASQETWNNAIAQADQHVVQRRVGEVRLLFPDARDNFELREQMVGLDPFIIHGRLAGLLCRLSDSALGNVTRGASVVPVFCLP